MTEERELQLNVLMDTIPHAWRYRWCTAGACACMGCVNHTLLSQGFTQQDHSHWVGKHPRSDGYGGEANRTYWTYSQSMN